MVPLNRFKIKQAYRIAGHVRLLAELRQECHYLRVSSLSVQELGRKFYTVLFLVKKTLRNIQKFFRKLKQCILFKFPQECSEKLRKSLREMGGYVGSAPACYGSYLGSNPDIFQKYKMGDISKRK